MKKKTASASATPAPSPLRIDRRSLKQLLRTLETQGVSEFEYEDANLRLRIARGPVGRVVVQEQAPLAVSSGSSLTSAAPLAAALPDEDVIFITSPFVGTFYRAPSPDAATFCDVGSTIKIGQTLCIIEAMKLMNEIEADVSGTIVEVMVDNGKSVEFGQKLFKLRRT
ncbi:MAG: acetyl-CoA carboxylase biotin carboxyl carrier protein [Myxococcales bacterium]|nr:MAG: acetyl-CoA carboxylase biotin carboxyl carrier protein [Myxococcales bacterium]